MAGSFGGEGHVNEGGFVYVFAEGEADEIAAMRRGSLTPKFYKVGKALWGRNGPSRTQPFRPVQERLQKAQSCNPRRLGALATFQFGSDQRAQAAERTYHGRFRAQHGVRLWPLHEWYHGQGLNGRPWMEAADVLATEGGIDVTDRLPPPLPCGGYEEGPCENSRSGEVFPVNIYTMRLDDDGQSYFRVLATSYPNKSNSADNPHRWYNTDNPRPVMLVHRVTAEDGISAVQVNEAAKRIMADLVKRYGPQQISHTRVPNPSWNTLAWFPALPETFLRVFNEIIQRHWGKGRPAC